MVFAIAFVPDDTDVPMPPWAAELPALGAADPAGRPHRRRSSRTARSPGTAPTHGPDGTVTDGTVTDGTATDGTTTGDHGDHRRGGEHDGHDGRHGDRHVDA